MMNDWKIPKLQSGGVITNYHCTSKCKHCLYNCHPNRQKTYLSPQTALTIFSHIRRHGCRSVHIGGGEPMLKPDALLKILESAGRAGVGIDYVETNASWFIDMSSAMQLLKAMRRAGMAALLVSISPFHNEYIPFYKTRGVLEACRDIGLQVIPWSADFLPFISQLDEKKTHPLKDYQPFWQEGVLQQIKKSYWIHWGGRSLDTYREHLPLYSYEQLLEQSTSGCMQELASTHHFHIDLHGRYIPGLCSGLSISMSRLGDPLSIKTHPILSRLALKGIKALAQWVEHDFNYKAKKRGYINKCDLCNDIRFHLAHHRPIEGFEELDPVSFYRIEKIGP